MPRPATRANRLICDALQSCTTPQVSSRFRRLVRLLR